MQINWNFFFFTDGVDYHNVMKVTVPCYLLSSQNYTGVSSENNHGRRILNPNFELCQLLVLWQMGWLSIGIFHMMIKQHVIFLDYCTICLLYLIVNHCHRVKTHLQLINITLHYNIKKNYKIFINWFSTISSPRSQPNFGVGGVINRIVKGHQDFSFNVDTSMKDDHADSQFRITVEKLLLSNIMPNIIFFLQYQNLAVNLQKL
jgi:hypothetical protein